MAAVTERPALRGPFAAPPAGEVEDLRGPARQRQQGGDTAEVVRNGVRVQPPGDRGPYREHPGGVQPVGEGEIEGRAVLGEVDDQFAVALLGSDETGLRRGAGACQMALVGGGAGPAVGLGGPDGELPWFVQGVVERGTIGGERERGALLVREAAQILTPVQDPGQRS